MKWGIGFVQWTEIILGFRRENTYKQLTVKVPESSVAVVDKEPHHEHLGGGLSESDGSLVISVFPGGNPKSLK
jgi:hypothetical protein